jgi:predicted DNA-binding transcriptional regulator AlpA
MTSQAPLLRVAEAAEFLGLSVSKLNKMRVFGGGPDFLKLGSRVAYAPADLNAWLQTRRRSSTSDTGAASATSVPGRRG